jgi:hypothetical protein
MINFSSRDTIPNLLTAVAALEDPTNSVPPSFLASAKQIALDRLTAIPQGPTVNAANFNLRVNVIGGFQQLEMQVATMYIKPANPAPVAPVIAALLTLLLLLCGLPVKAQTFGGPLQLTTGGTNAPVYPATTNYGALTLPNKILTVSNINTNETLVASYGITFPGQTIPIAVVSSTNTFPASAGYTNGQTVTISFYPPAITLPLVQWMMVTNGTPGTYTNGLYTP